VPTLLQIGQELLEFAPHQMDLSDPGCRDLRQNWRRANVVAMKEHEGNPRKIEIILGPTGTRGGNDYWSRMTVPSVNGVVRLTKLKDERVQVQLDDGEDFFLYPAGHTMFVDDLEKIIKKPDDLDTVLADPQGAVILELRFRADNGKKFLYVRRASGIYVPTAVGIVQEWPWTGNSRFPVPFDCGVRVEVDKTRKGLYAITPRTFVGSSGQTHSYSYRYTLKGKNFPEVFKQAVREVVEFEREASVDHLN
jgi:hypothetical protein